MTHPVTPPVANDARHALVVRVTIVVAVLIAVGLGVSGYVATAAEPFSIDEPAPTQTGRADGPVRASGSAGTVAPGAMWVLASEPGSAGQALYTIGDQAAVADGRWSGAVTPSPEVTELVVIRADAECGIQLAEMRAFAPDDARFFGPLPGGCVELGRVPVSG